MDDGETGTVHCWLRGLPQSRELPRNEEAGKRCREDGMEPLKLLKLRFKWTRAGSWPS